MFLERERRDRLDQRVRDGVIMVVMTDISAYNVDETSSEKPGIPGINDWDEYWKSFTEQNFADQKCASCGCVLNMENRVGAHVRMKGEPDNTNDAWIALFCKGCNNSREIQKLRTGSWIVKTRMNEAHPNVPTAKDRILKALLGK